MPNLLLRPPKGYGRLAQVTPASAGWTYVGFELYRLRAGETVTGDTGTNEACLVFVTGKGAANVAGEAVGVLGERMSVFEGKPHSLYVPEGRNWAICAETELELAVCLAPGRGGGLPVRTVGPDNVSVVVRGEGTNTRYVTNILAENGHAADSLLVVEVVTPGGHTSSYPPHKHDRDALPDESYLEETYYHRLNPPQGFAFQRVYTDRDASGARELDEAMAVEDGDVVLVPKGYHPCAACHGYDLWYLNVMAGPTRTWRFHNAPEHAWMLAPPA